MQSYWKSPSAVQSPGNGAEVLSWLVPGWRDLVPAADDVRHAGGMSPGCQDKYTCRGFGCHAAGHAVRPGASPPYLVEHLSK